MRVLFPVQCLHLIKLFNKYNCVNVNSLQCLRNRRCKFCRKTKKWLRSKKGNIFVTVLIRITVLNLLCVILSRIKNLAKYWTYLVSDNLRPYSSKDIRSISRIWKLHAYCTVRYAFLSAWRRVLHKLSCTLFARYGSICERYGSLCERYGSFCERYGSLCERYGTLCERTGSLLARYALLKIAARFVNGLRALLMR